MIPDMKLAGALSARVCFAAVNITLSEDMVLAAMDVLLKYNTRVPPGMGDLLIWERR